MRYIKAKTLKNIANAIRKKRNKSSLLTAEEMPAEILKITSAETPRATAEEDLKDIYAIHINTLEEVANAIRRKTGRSNLLTAEEMPSEILGIQATEITAEDLQGCTEIEDYAFINNTYLESIEIPGTVTKIGDGAFYGCTNLKSITIPDSVKSIGILAFCGCENLTSVTIPNSIENVNIGAFYDCAKLQYKTESGLKYLGNEANPYLYCEGATSRLTITSATIKSGCKIIGAGAFLGGVALKSVTIPDTVTKIDDYAFRSCSRLTTVTFGSNSTLKEIGKEAFRGCKGIVLLGGGITSITIPDSVERIGRGAFRECDKLASITLPFTGRTKAPNERHSHFGYIFGANGYLDNSKYIPSSLTTVNITKAEYIGDNAFYGCSNLIYLEIYDSDKLEHIGQNAFYGCTNLHYANYGTGLNFIGSQNNIYLYITGVSDNTITGVEIPSSCKFIAKDAFKNCENLLEVTLGDNLKDIGDNAFKYNSTKLKYNLSGEIKYLGSKTNPHLYCLGANSITNNSVVNLEAGCKFIGSMAFYNQSNSFTIQGNPRVICSSVFESSGLKSFNATNLLRIGDYAFYGSKLQSITTEAQFMGEMPFKKCANLTKVNISKINTLGEQAFVGCSSLKKVDLSKTNITNLKDKAFQEFSGAVTLNNKIEVIGKSTFENATITNELKIPETVISIESNAFNNCKITSNKVIFDGTADQWAQIEFGDAKATPLRYALNDKIGLYIGGKLAEDITLKKVYKISDYAFYDYRKIKSVIIPDTVTSIGASSFENCFNLTKAEMSENSLFDFTEAIEIAGFNLSELGITIDEDVGKIKDYAFYNTGLKEFTIPAGTKAIGKKAFNYTSGQTQTLTKVYAKPEIPPTIPDSETFPPNITVYTNSVDAYKTATNWGNYEITVYIPLTATEITAEDLQGLTEIPANAFANYSNLERITIPDNVRSIGDYAFNGCSKLASVTIGNGVTSIGSYVFQNCSSLTSIEIPDSVTSIGRNAFAYCSSLTSVNYTGTIDQWAQISFGNSGSNPKYYDKDLYINNELVTNANITTATKINDYAFYNCDNLTSVTIGNGVTSIGSYAFQNCSSLTSITIGDSVESIGDGAFQNCPIENATIPTIAILYIPKSKLKTVVITSGESIGSSAFFACTSLTSITIGDSVESIGDGAFQNCSSLTSIKIPDSVTSIGNSAFYRCTNLWGIEIGDSVTSIGVMAFEDTAYYNDPSNKENGILYIGKYLIRANTTIEECTIKEDALVIAGQAFKGCSKLASVTIPNSVRSIGFCAFSDCTSLTSIEIPDSVTSIEEYAFGNVPIIIIKATTPPKLDGKLGFNNNPKEIYVTATATAEAYKSADGWSEYADIIQQT